MLPCLFSSPRKTRALPLLISLLLAPAALTLRPAYAQTLGADIATVGTATLFGNNITFGWAFTPTSPITLTDLGLWDENNNGLAQATPVGIWNGAGTLLASTTIPAGTAGTTATTSALAGTPSNAWRFVSVTPLALTTGNTYTLGAYYGGGSPDTQHFLVPTTGAAITYVGGATSNVGTGLLFPSTISSGGGAYLGPNFRYSAFGGAAPEPNAIALLTLTIPILRPGGSHFGGNKAAGRIRYRLTGGGAAAIQ